MHYTILTAALFWNMAPHHFLNLHNIVYITPCVDHRNEQIWNEFINIFKKVFIISIIKPKNKHPWINRKRKLLPVSVCSSWTNNTQLSLWSKAAFDENVVLWEMTPWVSDLLVKIPLKPHQDQKFPRFMLM